MATNMQDENVPWNEQRSALIYMPASPIPKSKNWVVSGGPGYISIRASIQFRMRI
jgi:hypothetical protein